MSEIEAAVQLATTGELADYIDELSERSITAQLSRAEYLLLAEAKQEFQLRAAVVATGVAATARAVSDGITLLLADPPEHGWTVQHG